MVSVNGGLEIKFKKRIRTWLGIEQNNKDINAIIHSNCKRLSDLEKENRILSKENELFKSMCDVGVDMHMKTDSWAVVCISGKAEYVQFVRLDSREARDIKYFLKRFEKSNVKVDAPYGFLKHFKW